MCDGNDRGGVRTRVGARCAKGALRLCLKLRQGASPLKPPPPLPCNRGFQNGWNLSRVRRPRKNRAPLTDPIRSEKPTNARQRGHKAKNTPDPVRFCLTEAGLLMEAARGSKRLFRTFGNIGFGSLS